MSSGNEILYIKGEKNTEVKEPNVTLGDILTMECSNSSIMNRIKPLRILKIPKKEQHRYVVSVLKIIECIHREIPGLQIQNKGESDLIITYEGEKKRNTIWQGIKVVVVAGITFIGAAFSIMAFNKDVFPDLSASYRRRIEWIYPDRADLLHRADHRDPDFFQSFRKKEIYSRSDADGSGNAFV